MPEKEIKKYHLLKDQPEKLQFGMHHFVDQANHNLCLHLQPHTHSFYQIIWFKEDGGKHFIDFEEYDIRKNTLFFIAKDQVHFFEQDKDYDGILMHFNESFILSSETDINFFLTYHIFNNKQKPYYQIPSELVDAVTNYFAQIESELSKMDEFGNGPILSNLLKSLLLVIEREIRKEAGGANPVHTQNVVYLKFRDLLENNFKHNWSVSDYAQELAVSTKTLNTIVKLEIEKTVSQAVVDRIILEAKRQLIHTNALVNQIAYALGFQDPYYFIKYFKKHVHCTPTEFRKSIS